MNTVPINLERREPPARNDDLVLDNDLIRYLFAKEHTNGLPANPQPA